MAALEGHGRAVLEAPPGAGKTTVVPLAILEAGLSPGRIVMLEPRRLAARAAAARMAELLGEPLGQTVGYRIRGEAKVSRATRIEVVTEGILTRMLQSDPALEGIGAVIFDEFHERSLQADLGLALTWEAREALREDLLLLVMSATLDGGPVAAMLGEAPRVTAEGRAFPVETRWLERPHKGRFEAAMADLITRAYGETEGSVLAFLPGEGEIRRVQAALTGMDVRPLYGALPFAQQKAAIREDGARKVVLATSIAETSLTIEGIRVVVDGGRARRARFNPGTGMSGLVTERVSRAEAEQRRGRAGRVAPGVCYRLWTKGEEGGLRPFPPTEIETGDLAPLALELALWGAAPDALAFLTPPNPGGLAEAQALLTDLGALDGGLTEHGKALARLPVHPRLGHMLLTAGAQAAPLAALLAGRERGPTDLATQLERFDREASRELKAEAKRLARLAPERSQASAPQGPAAMAALAYPDRIGLRRPGDAPSYLLSGGRGALMPAEDPLAGQRLIVAADLDGEGREARVRRALAISEAELRAVLGDRIGWVDLCRWSRRHRRIEARRQERLGAIVLDDRIWRDAPEAARVAAAVEGVRDLGLAALGWSDAARRFRARVALFAGDGLPDMSDGALVDRLETWLAPYLAKVRTAEDIARLDPLPALKAMLDWDQTARLDREAPASVETPLGRKVPVEYGGEAPAISVKLQEMFGLERHPVVGPNRLPLRITLLSPAGRPVQVTTDLPGFWRGAYGDVRKDMRGRYPKHPWPEEPWAAAPTTRAKPRK